MIVQTLTYGGLDLAPMCKKNSLKVTPVRKVGRQWNDINSNNHTTTAGWSYQVKVELNPLTYSQAQALYAMINSGPKSLVFQYAGLASAITQSSIAENLPLSPTFAATYCKADEPLVFTEAY